MSRLKSGSFGRVINKEYQMKIRVEDVLQYHSTGKRGKVEVVPTKPCMTQRDLSLAYTPGVAEVWQIWTFLYRTRSKSSA